MPGFGFRRKLSRRRRGAVNYSKVASQPPPSSEFTGHEDLENGELDANFTSTEFPALKLLDGIKEVAMYELPCFESTIKRRLRPRGLIKVYEERDRIWYKVYHGRNEEGWVAVNSQEGQQELEILTEYKFYQVWPGNSTFWFGGRLMLGPGPGVPLALHLAYAAAAAFQCLLVFPHYPAPTRAAWAYPSLLLALPALYHLWRTQLDEPGLHPRAERAAAARPVPTPDTERRGLVYCDVCGIFRPRGDRHCWDCGGCVAEHDHHCFCVGTCVGRRNYRHFVRFLLWTALAAAAGAGWSGALLLRRGRAQYAAALAAAAASGGGGGGGGGGSARPLPARALARLLALLLLGDRGGGDGGPLLAPGAFVLGYVGLALLALTGFYMGRFRARLAGAGGGVRAYAALAQEGRGLADLPYPGAAAAAAAEGERRPPPPPPRAGRCGAPQFGGGAGCNGKLAGLAAALGESAQAALCLLVWWPGDFPSQIPLAALRRSMVVTAEAGSVRGRTSSPANHQLSASPEQQHDATSEYSIVMEGAVKKAGIEDVVATLAAKWGDGQA